MPTQLEPVFFFLLLVPVTVPLQSTTAAIRIPAEDIIRRDVSEYETSLSVDDFVDDVSLPEVSLHSLGLQNNEDPLLRAGKFEGDIAGFAGATPQTFKHDPVGVAHSAARDSWRRWADGEVPYVLSSLYGRLSRRIIARAMDEFHKKTCIRFVPRERLKHRDYIYIKPDSGCYSMVGRMGGPQPLSLDDGCMQVGIVVHELMHTTGFFHEQSRTDRDDYIRVVWRNIRPDAMDQFDKYDSRTLDLLGTTYDYNSIMHYGPYAFSRNGQRTIEPLKPGGEEMGQRNGLSATDIYKLNKLYSCEELSNGANEERPEATPQPTIGTIKPVSPTRKGTRCENKKWECYFWKWLDHCKTNKVFMRENCMKACNWCTDDDDGLDVSHKNRLIYPYATGVPKRKLCEDANGHCEKWSKAGYCDKIGYRHFMAATCAESCGKCSPTAPSSGTDDTSQHSLSRMPSTQIPDYEVALNGSNSVSGCTDSEGFRHRCELYASWGMCQGYNNAFMEKICAKSCKLCSHKES